MPARSAPPSRLVADVGGTNTRLALFEPATNAYRALTTYINRDYGRFEDILASWLENLDEPKPTQCCIAVAAPPADDRVTMINIDWSFSCRDVARRFGFADLRWLNDFQSNAYALPHLLDADKALLRAGTVADHGKLATVGPGTGLGGATLEIMTGQPPLVHACEPGHMGLAPATPLELELFRVLLPRHGELHAELLVSGPGLQRLYQTLAVIHGQTAATLTPAEVSQRALQTEDGLCQEALKVFCGLLGSVCGDFVLANGAYAGLYLAGGIVPRMVPFLRDSQFTQRFQHKGAMQDHLSRVPLYVITTPQPGLIGAAHAPL